jgi:hypothetical protein
MENLNNTDKTSDNAEKELRISDVRNSILERIEGYESHIVRLRKELKNIDNVEDSLERVTFFVNSIRDMEVLIKELNSVLKYCF